MSSIPIPFEDFPHVFQSTTELSSAALGGQVLSVSDEFFAEAFQVLLVEPPLNLKGQFGPNGALYSGWESSRHNEQPFHYCILAILPGYIVGFDIDTSFFNGNEAPEVSVEGLISVPYPTADDPRWTEILGRVKLGPSRHHLFQISQTQPVSFVKLKMYPDGGIARFRVYGHVAPVLPANADDVFDLAHVFSGARVVFTSNQHFGVASNLLLPGRGRDMRDGWETKRSRIPGHKDWVIIKLGVPGYLVSTEVDTANFKGNFPESCELHATFIPGEVEWTQIRQEETEWIEVLPRTKLGPHRQHYHTLKNTEGRVYTHVKLTIYPDGGIKRLRIIGRRAEMGGGTSPFKLTQDVNPKSTPVLIPLQQLTAEGFMPFGQVIQAYDRTPAPQGIRITPANNGTATKFHKLSLLKSSYDEQTGATAGLSVYHCKPSHTIGENLRITMLERHPYTNQAFVPMGTVGEQGPAYVVVVAQNGKDGKPAWQTMVGFLATASQGVVYDTGVWHLPMTVLRNLDFTCVETQIGDGNPLDCEVVDVGETIYEVEMPP